MKKIGRILFIGCLALSLSSALFGQRPKGNPDPTKRALEQSDFLAKELKLDADQQVLVQALLLASSEKIMTAREVSKDRESMRKEVTKIKDEQNEMMKEILSESQYAEYVKIQQENMKKVRRERGPEGQNPDQN